jgi:autophagy-related protein 5
MHARPPSSDATVNSEKDGVYNVRSVPVRVYLPDGPVLQDLAPPLLEDGEFNLMDRQLPVNHRSL